MSAFDSVVANGTVVLPSGPVDADIGIANGSIVAIGRSLEVSSAETVIDATGRFVLPGAVDAHFHLGIYRGLSEDAVTETLSSLVGGVTTVISYFRTGTHYLGKSGPYREIFPEVLEATEGHAWTDYAYHLAPMLRAHVDEIGPLVREHGVASFKYYMFYKGLDLAGDSLDAGSYTMAEHYDLGHLLEIMERVAEVQDDSPGTRVSLSIHCEQPELIRVFLERMQAGDAPEDLEAYSASRPPLTEQLAIAEVRVLAEATRCPVNLLHLSGAEALGAALELRRALPWLDVRLETTAHHLALSYETYSDQRGKVNPPIRSEADREVLWQGVVNGDIDWIVSDHACCSEEKKEGSLWSALPGFGGTALLYPLLLTEGPRRGLTLERVTELVATNPARAYGLAPRKGAIAVGADADLAIVDLDQVRPVTPALLLSAQEYTPFQGMELLGWPVATLLRGRVVYQDGQPVGEPAGRYLSRPLQAASVA